VPVYSPSESTAAILGRERDRAQGVGAGG
jgi:hypothetical protein